MTFFSDAKKNFTKFRYDLKHEVSTKDKMSAKERLSMALVDSGGNNCITSLKSSFFNVFLTTSLGLDASTIATLALITTILGYIKDPVCSLIIEATRTKWGRFKPYVMTCMPATVLLTFAFMMNPFTDNYTAKVAYVFTLEILLSIIGGFSGAWGNMKLCLSRDNEDKEKYFKMGKVFRDITGCIPGIIPIFIDIFKQYGISNRYIFIGMAVLLFPFSLYSAFQARHLTERVALPAREKFFLGPKDLLYNIGMVFKNKNAMLLWLLRVGNILNYVADIACAYVFMYCYGWYSLLTIAGVCGGVVSWLFLINSKKVFNKLSYKGVAIGYKSLMALSMFILFFVRYGNAWYYWVIVCVCRMIGASLEQIEGMATSLFETQVWDHYEWKTGVRNESVTGLIGSYVCMPISIIQPIFYAYMFDKIGFVEGENIAQSAETLDGLFNIYTIFIALGCICDIIPYVLIRLNKQTMDKVEADLHVREEVKDAWAKQGKTFQPKEIIQINTDNYLQYMPVEQENFESIENTVESTEESVSFVEDAEVVIESEDTIGLPEEATESVEDTAETMEKIDIPEEVTESAKDETV